MKWKGEGTCVCGCGLSSTAVRGSECRAERRKICSEPSPVRQM